MIDQCVCANSPLHWCLLDYLVSLHPISRKESGFKTDTQAKSCYVYNKSLGKLWYDLGKVIDGKDEIEAWKVDVYSQWWTFIHAKHSRCFTMAMRLRNIDVIFVTCFFIVFFVGLSCSLSISLDMFFLIDKEIPRRKDLICSYCVE
jgi:sensor histidine kinase YesM